MNRRELIKAAAVGGIRVMLGTFLSGCSNKSTLGIGHQNLKGLIRGKVLSGDTPLEGVRCSDGREVVITDSQGRFAINSDGRCGPFVSVVTPKGYWTDRFYVPTSQAIKQETLFNLKVIGASERYSAVFMTDTHLGDGNVKLADECFAATLDELNVLPNQPAFIIDGGDISLQAHQGDRYVELMSRLKMPVRNCFGNHEMIKELPNPKQRFYDLFGPSYYSFDYGNIHYVVMDGCSFVPQNEGWKNVIGYVGEVELAWLENDLKLVPKGMPSIVSIHIPLISTYPERRSLKTEESPWWVVSNNEEVIKVLNKFNVPCVMQGHVHENERIFKGTTEFVGSVSVSGSWWRTKPGRELAVSGEPRGYRIIDVDGTRISHRYMSSAELHVDEPGEFINLKNNRLPAGSELVVNFFDASNEAKVFGRVNNGPWSQWLPANIPSPYRKDLIAVHHWSCPNLPLTGRYHFEVRCEDRHRADTTLQRSIQIA